MLLDRPHRLEAERLAVHRLFNGVAIALHRRLFAVTWQLIVQSEFHFLLSRASQ
jgi:hypothetical protein